jgi:hypothetical protein
MPILVNVLAQGRAAGFMAARPLERKVRLSICI